MEQLKRKIAIVLFFVLLLGGFADVQAAVITSVSRGGTSTNDPPIIAPNSLNEDELCYVDRTHKYSSVPTTLIGAEYVMVSNSDKSQADYSLQVGLAGLAKLYLFLDNRLGHYDNPGHDPFLNPDLWAAGMGWVYDMGFRDTGQDIGIDEAGDGNIDQWSSVYDLEVPAGGIVVLLQQNDATNPGNRNMYGVAALERPLFAPFWSPPGIRIPLVPQTFSWIPVPTGFWGGWYWGQHEGHYFYPGQGYIGQVTWVQDQNDTGNTVEWQGFPYFWAFTGSHTFRYSGDTPGSLYFWNYFWSNGNEGHCLQLITGDNKVSPNFPLDPNIVAHLEIQNSMFNVNAGEVRAEREEMFMVQVHQLEEHVRKIEGMREEAVQGFITSTIIAVAQAAASICGECYVGVQHAKWSHPMPLVLCSTESLEVGEEEQVCYGIKLAGDPCIPVTINVSPILVDPVNPIEILDADPISGIFQLQFDQQNWDQWQMVHLKGIVEASPPPNKTIAIAQYLAHDPNEGSVIPVTILDSKTGGLGYLNADMNFDAQVDFKDLGLWTADWLLTTKPPTKVPFDGDFLDQGIGTTGGNATYDAGSDVWTLEGDGHDVWDTTDGFHYAYKPIVKSVHTRFTATVRTLEDTHIWAKAGIMFREKLTPDSAHAMIVVTPHRGVAFQWRQWIGHITETIQYGPVAHLKAPISLRLEVKDNIANGYYYQSGRWIRLLLSKWQMDKAGKRDSQS